MSILNSAIATSGKQFNFTFGLGVSQIGDAWMASDSGLLSTVGVLVSFAFSGLFLLLAWLAQHTRVALPIGIAVYAVDALLFVVAQDGLGLGFHAFALFLNISGWATYRRMVPTATAPPVLRARKTFRVPLPRLSGTTFDRSARTSTRWSLLLEFCPNRHR